MAGPNRDWRNRMHIGDQVTAVEMAKAAGVLPKEFFRALEAAQLPWHRSDLPWIAERDSPEHRDMEAVLGEIIRPYF